MKRPALALSAGIVLLALMPGSAAAGTIVGVLDQWDTAITMNVNASQPLAQTFTAGKTGLVNDVQLYMASGSGSISATIKATIAGLPDDSTVLAISAPASPTATAGWVTFSFAPPAAVFAETTYAIVFNMSSLDGPPTPSASGSGDTYGRGQALTYTGSAWTAVNADFKDFAFQTYVDPQTTKLQWDKAQVVAGASAALTLTETFVFPAFVVAGAAPMGAQPNAPDPAVRTLQSDALPAWFTPTGVTCAGQVAPADCTPANVAPGHSLPVTPDGNPISIVLTLTGTASPALADVGTGTGKAEGCAGYPEFIPPNAVAPAQQIQSCVAAQATVAVVAPAATPTPAPNPTPTPAPNATPTPTPRPATPPPTTAGGSDSSNGPGPSIWFLPIGLVVAAGGALLLVDRQQRRIR